MKNYNKNNTKSAKSAKLFNMISKATRRFIVTNKLKQGLPLSEEQMQWQKELGITISAKEPKERNVRHTPKDKAKFAVEQRGGEKWMQKWVMSGTMRFIYMK